MMKKILLSLVFLSCLCCSQAYAIPQGSFVNPITDTAFEEILPIKMAGITLAQGSGYDTPDAASAPYCMCPIPLPPYIRIGLPISFWEPARVAETVKDPFWFPSLGLSIPIGSGAGGQLAGSNRNNANNMGGTLFQAHWVLYPVYSVLGLFTDMACMESSGGIDMLYMTELDPLWNSDDLSAFIHPEVFLFANPVAQMACIADAVSVNAWRPIEALFWCMGSGGSSYPMTGRTHIPEIAQASMAVANRLTYKLSRQLLLTDKALNWCMPVFAPIWVKPHYKYQMLRPSTQRRAHPVGKSSWFYQTLANPPTGTGKGSADNFAWLVFQKRVCCFL